MSDALSAADRLDILELLARYAWAFDTRDGDAYAEVFTEDGVMEGPRSTISGRADLRTWAADFPPDVLQHRVTNTVIDGDAAEAQVRSYLVATSVEDDGIRDVLLGEYHDIVRRTSKGWKIAKRRLVIHKWVG